MFLFLYVGLGVAVWFFLLAVWTLRSDIVEQSEPWLYWISLLATSTMCIFVIAIAQGWV